MCHFFTLLSILSVLSSPLHSFAQTSDTALTSRLKGSILLQVEQHGEAWYVRPSDGLRYYMKDGDTAYSMMRNFSLGITNANLAKIPAVSDTTEMKGSSSACAANTLANQLKGDILLQVESHGEAWYVDPNKCRAIYMKDGAAAYEIMRYLGLGIADGDLVKISSGNAPVNSTHGSLYSVTDVVDGDTVKVNINGTVETLRLIGIDTPETVDPQKPVQCFGKEASDKAKELLTGKQVALEADASQGDRDKYGRLLRYVYLEDGTSFNEYMISEGYAHEYTYDTAYKYQSDFKNAEVEAKQAGKGFWNSTTCNGDTTQPAGSSSSSTSTDVDGPEVKKSTSGICHEKGVSPYYDQTKTYTSYNSIDDCLASGGRLPQ